MKIFCSAHDVLSRLMATIWDLVWASGAEEEAGRGCIAQLRVRVPLIDSFAKSHYLGRESHAKFESLQ